MPRSPRPGVDRARRLAVAERNCADANAGRARRGGPGGRRNGGTLALDTIGTLISEVQEQLGHSAGTIALRQRLSETALKRLEQIAENPSGEPDVALAKILAQERMGELAFLAGKTDLAKETLRTRPRPGDSHRGSERRKRRRGQPAAGPHARQARRHGALRRQHR